MDGLPLLQDDRVTAITQKLLSVQMHATAS